MEQFREMDRLKEDSFQQQFQERTKEFGLCVTEGNAIVAFSRSREGPVPAYSVYFET